MYFFPVKPMKFPLESLAVYREGAANKGVPCTKMAKKIHAIKTLPELFKRTK